MKAQNSGEDNGLTWTRFFIIPQELPRDSIWGFSVILLCSWHIIAISLFGLSRCNINCILRLLLSCVFISQWNFNLRTFQRMFCVVLTSGILYKLCCVMMEINLMSCPQIITEWCCLQRDIFFYFLIDLFVKHIWVLIRSSCINCCVLKSLCNLCKWPSYYQELYIGVGAGLDFTFICILELQCRDIKDSEDFPCFSFSVPSNLA